jgi:hypothetical protein
MRWQRWAVVFAAAGLAGSDNPAVAQMAIFPPPNQPAVITRSYGPGGLFRSRSVPTWTTTPGYVPSRIVVPSVGTTYYSSPPALYTAPSVRSVAPQGSAPPPPTVGTAPAVPSMGTPPAVPSIGYTPAPAGVGAAPAVPSIGYQAPPPPPTVYYGPRYYYPR